MFLLMHCIFFKIFQIEVLQLSFSSTVGNKVLTDAVYRKNSFFLIFLLSNQFDFSNSFQLIINKSFPVFKTVSAPQTAFEKQAKNDVFEPFLKGFEQNISVF